MAAGTTRRPAWRTSTGCAITASPSSTWPSAPRHCRSRPTASPSSTTPPTRCTRSPPTPSAPCTPPPARRAGALEPTHKEHHMTHPGPAAGPEPALFDVTTLPQARADGTLARVALDHLTLAPNPPGPLPRAPTQRRQINREGIERLAGMLCRTGQLVPCIGHQPHPSHPQVVIY